MFTFHFNLILTHEGLMRNYTLHKSCPLTLPWAPREVTCESNYMEVRSTELKIEDGAKFDSSLYVRSAPLFFFLAFGVFQDF